MSETTATPDAALLYGRKNQKGHNVVTTIAMTAFHAGAVAALFFVDAGAIAVAAVLYCAAGMLGIGMGYHRLLTHRGYKTYKPVEYFLTWCGTLALEGGPIFWVATHRIHHQHSDRDGDPHTPREGTWWAHAGWIISGEGLHHDAAVLGRYAPDLARDPVHVWLSTWHWTSNVVVGLALLAFGGIPYVGDAQVGFAPVRDPGRLDEQLVGGAADLRRGLAQQPPRASHQRPARSRLVRGRSQLDRHPHARRPRAGVGHQASAARAAVSFFSAPSHPRRPPATSARRAFPAELVQ
jgi:hypothetical protein